MAAAAAAQTATNTAFRSSADHLKSISDYVDDPHITCLDTFSLNPVHVNPVPGPLEAFCQIPADHAQSQDPHTVTIAPGLDVIDFYGSTEKSEVWLNGACFDCLVPRTLQGWEFYTVLHPEPEGCVPVVMNPDSSGPKIDLLFGRPPGALQCPSLLFVIVPVGQQYRGPQQSRAPTRQAPPGPRGHIQTNRNPHSYEKACGNLDADSRSLRPRLLALCPSQIYDESAVLPDGSSWGLFVGPRHRRLLLLNRTKGRMDVHLLMLFSMDAVFHGCLSLIESTARLYEPFGTAEQAMALFSEIDPMKVHCGLTNAVIADHVVASVDGRDDFRRLLGVWPHSFFVSNGSDNLRFLTPLEVQHHRTGRDAEYVELPTPLKLDDFPQWVLGVGKFGVEEQVQLRKFRTRAIPPSTSPQKNGRSFGVLQLLGLNGTGCSEMSFAHPKMISKMGGCAEMTFGGSQPWQEPGTVIDATRPDPGHEAEAPDWLDVFGGGKDKSSDDTSSIHWRHSADLVPGADIDQERSGSRPANRASVSTADMSIAGSAIPAAANRASMSTADMSTAASTTEATNASRPEEKMSDAFAATLQAVY